MSHKSWGASVEEDSELGEELEQTVGETDNKSDALRDVIRAGLGISEGEKRHTSSQYGIEIELSEYESRVVGNRLWKFGERYRDDGMDHVADETQWLARRFHAECNTRGDGDDD